MGAKSKELAGESGEASHETNTMNEDLDPKTFVLSLLVANESSPVLGKIMFVKQMFIIAKEIFPPLSKNLSFFPYKWGPYSNDLAELINDLIDEEDIVLVKNGRDFIFSLTPKGREIANEALRKIPTEIYRDIARMKRTTQDVGLKKVLQYVYTHYPQYAKYSRGKEVYCNS